MTDCDKSTASDEKRKLALFERSAIGNKLFAQKAMELGWMTAGEWVIYNHVTQAMQSPVDVYVWLSTRPHDCFDRIVRRGRPEDSTITLDWLASIHELHRRAFNTACTLDKPVIVLDGSIPVEAIAHNLLSSLSYLSLEP